MPVVGNHVAQEGGVRLELASVAGLREEGGGGHILVARSPDRDGGVTRLRVISGCTGVGSSKSVMVGKPTIG